MERNQGLALQPANSWLRVLGNVNLVGVNIFSPNLLTIYGLIVYWFGFAVYCWFNPVLGFMIAVLGGLLDVLDGKVSRAAGKRIIEPPEKWLFHDSETTAQIEEGGRTERRVVGQGNGSWGSKLWIELTFPGGTNLGQVIDPLTDKIKVVPTIFIFALLWRVLDPWLVVAAAIPEVVGTLMRRPFPLLRRWSNGPAATLVGKIKVYVQWAVVIVSIPIHQKLSWAEGAWENIPHFLLLWATAFSCASVISRWGKAR